MTTAELQLQARVLRDGVDVSVEPRPSSRAGHVRETATADGDFLSTPMPLMMLLVTSLPFIVLALWCLFIYIGIEYRSPPINNQNVPAPLLY